MSSKQASLILFISGFVFEAFAFNTCFDTHFGVPKCPQSEHTTLQCFSRKVPLSSENSINAANNFNDANLIVVPGDYLRCIITCKTKKDGPVENQDCQPSYFTTKIEGPGSIQNKQVGPDKGTIIFDYLAPNDIDKYYSQPMKVNLTVKLDGNIINEGKKQIEIPPIIDTGSILKCPYNYVKKNAAIECTIEPKSQGTTFTASPFEIEIEYGLEGNPKYGGFTKESYISIGPGRQNLVFQYYGGTTTGNNDIVAKISSRLPAWAAKDASITNSPLTLFTVVDKTEFYFSYTVYVLPLGLWMLFDVFTKLK